MAHIATRSRSHDKYTGACVRKCIFLMECLQKQLDRVTPQINYWNRIGVRIGQHLGCAVIAMRKIQNLHIGSVVFISKVSVIKLG